MTQDYYSTLGVDRNASSDDIKSAYRKMAMKHHPDRGGSNEEFQRIQEAYAVLGDDQKRAEYTNPQQNHFGFHFGHGGHGGGFDFNNIFNMFNQHHQQQQPPPQTRMSLWITLTDVARGGGRPVTISTHAGVMTVEIDIPIGINDGDNVQYGRIGPNGTDLIVNFRIHPNPKWQRNGLNLTTDLPVGIWDCLLGSDIQVQDILGNTITVVIPALTQPGSLLRLRGRGLSDRTGAQGDLFVRIQARMPSKIDPELAKMIEEHRRKG
jgi:DnaJ-class molecular chaperone